MFPSISNRAACGSVRFDVDDSGNLVLITGRFLVINRPHRLRFTWSASDWPDPTMISVVTVAFEPVGDDQTLMSIEHSALPPDFFDEYQDGWARTCDQFAAVLEGSKGSPSEHQATREAVWPAGRLSVGLSVGERL